MSKVRKYIIVDDDPINNIICRMLIVRTVEQADISIFEIPEEALAFIQNEYSKNLMATILFLDINMPTLTGWEFMEEYEKFSDEIKKYINIYILSSSVDKHDKDKAEINKYITGFISKPLNREVVLSIAGA